MKIGIVIDAESRKEADEIKRGLDDPSVRAFVKVMGSWILRGEPVHTLCGGRCFLEFLNALATRAKAAPDGDP